MSRVQRIELFHVELPLPEAISPFWYRGYRQEKQVLTLVRLTTEGGLQGFSAGWALGKEREGLKDWLPDAFLGVDVFDIHTIRQHLNTQYRWGWNNYWLETAFWDLQGKIKEKPLYQLFMAKPEVVDEVRVYAATQEYLELEQRLRSVESIQSMGVDALGVTLYGNPEEDLRLLEELRNTGGEDLLLILNAGQANRAWVGEEPMSIWKLSEALDFAASIEALEVEWLENPLDMYAYGDLSVLRSESTLPIAGGSLYAGWHEFKILMENNALDVYRPDATVSGGVTNALQVLDACVRRDLFFSPHCGRNSFSLLINLHLYAACPRKFLFEYPLEPGRWTPAIRDALLTEPLTLSADGTLPVPQSAGLGVELDEEMLQRHGTLWLDVEA